ncbi:MAG: hypothetical protein EOL88_14620 [Bacteroidia bacterium]|nr:hypothetical protein [Bacteroidia bacterium]
MFKIRMGVPEMETLWKDLSSRKDQGKLSKDEEEFFIKWVKTMGCLRDNPRHPSLNTHDIDPLTKRYGVKVWQSYLENKTSGARRTFWVYGPGRKEITILGIEPHPEDKKRGSYDRINLSDLPAGEI